MQRRISNIWALGVKELRSLAADPVLVILMLYTFTFAIYTVATGVKTEVRHASVAISDEDRSGLSARIRDALLEPFFKRPRLISVADIDNGLDQGLYAFVIDIPPQFEAMVLSGRRPTIQVIVDATAMTMAGNGTRYIASIVDDEIARYLNRRPVDQVHSISLVVRSRFNENLESSWFVAIMQIVNNITMLSLIVAGAAVIREREHGTIEHLLAMPVEPAEIMIAKIWANGLVILAAAIVSLHVVVVGILGVQIHGSSLLFGVGTALFLFAMAALGITLATIARSMPQFGLLCIPFFVVMNMLSGGISPQESMPDILQWLMKAAPSTHFTSLAQAVLYRGAGLDVVWPELASILAIGIALMGIALTRFRASMAAQQ